MKVNIVYWSGTGNTQAIAQIINDKLEERGLDVQLLDVNDTDANSALDCDILILGCPSYGAEQLEEGTFQPFWDEIKNDLSGKRVELFGSYDWGNGEWMQSWYEEAEDLGAMISQEGLIINLYPAQEQEEKCIEFVNNITI